MARVFSTLPNHSSNVNGIAFTLDRGQMISEEISEETATVLATIPGFFMVSTKAKRGKAAAAAAVDPAGEPDQDGEAEGEEPGAADSDNKPGADSGPVD